MAATNPPRENLVRAILPGIEITRTADSGLPTLRGHFSVFNQWTKIDSAWEGTFMERISPGAFAKTIRENRDQIKVLFNHGKDPQIGDKPLGKIADLREDDQGAYYEVDMFDTSYNRDLLPALDAGVLGASFRFRVLREDYNDRAKPSEFNPDGLPERTIREAAVSEFGPVTFPAYAGATAGVRSATDDLIVMSLLEEPERLIELIHRMRSAAQPGTERDATGPDTAPTETHAEAEPHLETVRRATSRELFLFAEPPKHLRGN